MLNLIKKIRRKVQFFIKFKIKFYICHVRKKRLFVCVDSAVHGNLGDQALGFCRIKLLEKSGINRRQIIDITSRDKMRYWNDIRESIIEDDVLILRGGGYFGTLWVDGFTNILEYIENFPHNSIILFPQSVYFDKSQNSQNLLLKSQNLINNRKNIYLFARDFNSYKMFKEYFPNCNVFVTPDTVLSYKPQLKKKQEKNVLLCLRNDKEKSLSDNTIRYIKDVLKKNNIKIVIQDTCIDFQLQNIKQREKVLYSIWKKFNDAELVITDRLHGMIFSTINSTPCIVFDNIDHKISNAYKWIDNLDYVKFIESDELLEEKLKVMQSLKNVDYPIDNIIHEFSPLISILKKFNLRGDL